jgi:hypothetical protein
MQGGKAKKKHCWLTWGVIAVTLLFMATLRLAASEAPKEIRIGCNGPITGMFTGFGEGAYWDKPGYTIMDTWAAML